MTDSNMNDSKMYGKRIGELIKRDTAMPLHKLWMSPGYDPVPSCPICKSVLLNVDSVSFCPKCGQRIDNQNWEIR